VYYSIRLRFLAAAVPVEIRLAVLRGDSIPGEESLNFATRQEQSWLG
jgi:hypothetical protein